MSLYNEMIPVHRADAVDTEKMRIMREETFLLMSSLSRQDLSKSTLD
jgi:hypothetical protein